MEWPWCADKFSGEELSSVKQLNEQLQIFKNRVNFIDDLD
jgi:hypothetical protein